MIECNGKFLLERLGYAHKKFTIPGGGVKKNETLEDATRREVFEEVGVRVGELRKISEYFNTRQYKRDTVTVFYTKVENPEFKVDGIEVTEAGWFGLNELPEDRVPRVDKLLAMLTR